MFRQVGELGLPNDLSEAGVKSGVVIFCDEHNRFFSAARNGMDNCRRAGEFGIDGEKSALSSRGGCIDLMGLIFMGVFTSFTPIIGEDADEERGSRLKVIRDIACFGRRPARELMDRD
jgi:hypothetical protein